MPDYDPAIWEYATVRRIGTHGGGPGLDNYVRVRVRKPVPVEASALFARMSIKPTQKRQDLINVTIQELKSAGIWTLTRLLYLNAAHDSQAARLNWKEARGDLAVSGAPTFTTDVGYAGDGVAAYLASGVSRNDFPGFLPTASTIAAKAAVLTGPVDTSILGLSGSSLLRIININASAQATTRLWDSGSIALNVSDGKRLISTSYDGVNAMNYVDGVKQRTDAKALNTSSSTFSLLRSFAVYSAHTVAFSFVGDLLNGTQHAALNSIINNYLTGVGLTV